MKGQIIPFSDANDMLECASLFAMYQTDVRIITPIYYPLYVVGTKYGNLLVDPDTNVSINIKYVTIPLNEITIMLKKLKEADNEDEFLEKVQINNIKLQEMVKKSENKYKNLIGIFDLNSMPIESEFDGIILPVKYDYESLKEVILKELNNIENEVESIFALIKNYQDSLKQNLEFWKKNIRIKMKEVEKEYYTQAYKMEENYNETIKLINENMRFYSEQMTKIMNEYKEELNRMENMYATELLDYEEKNKLLNKSLNDLLELKKNKLNMFENLYKSLRELYIDLLKQKIHELLEIRNHFLEDFIKEEKKLKDLTDLQVSKLKEEAQLLEKEIEQINKYYDNILLEKRKEIMNKEKALREEFKEKIEEILINYDIMSLMEQLIEVTKKYSKLEEIFGIISKSQKNLFKLVNEKEKLEENLETEKKVLKLKYDEAIKKLYDELTDLEKDRDEKIGNIQQKLERVYDKMYEITQKANKQVMDIQEGYRRNTINIDLEIEEVRKFLETIEKSRLESESLKEFPTFNKLIESIIKSNEEIAELQNQIDENEEKLNKLQEKMNNLRLRLENEKQNLTNKYESQNMEYLKFIKDNEKTLAEIKKARESELNNLQKEMQSKFAELKMKDSFLDNILSEAEVHIEELCNKLKIDFNQFPVILSKITEGTIYVKLYVIVFANEKIEVIQPFQHYCGKNQKKPLFESDFFFNPFTELRPVIPEKITRSILKKLEGKIELLNSHNVLKNIKFITRGLKELNLQGWIGKARIKKLESAILKISNGCGEESL